MRTLVRHLFHDFCVVLPPEPQTKTAPRLAPPEARRSRSGLDDGAASGAWIGPVSSWDPDAGKPMPKANSIRSRASP